jgi:DNA-binding transcriptional MerR regulator
MIAPTISKDGAQIPRLALTTEETAAALGVKPTTIWRLTQRGLLTPNRATRRPLYSVADIERFLQEGKA